jgi:hypothetical protein
VGAVDGKPVFPAIAIPVEKKARFECPPEMLEALAGLLPGISKLVVIGWRATEAHFLSLLANKLTGLRPGIPLRIVAGSENEAAEIRAKIHRALLNNQPNSSLDPGGFTDFILSRRAEQFLGN